MNKTLIAMLVALVAPAAAAGAMSPSPFVARGCSACGCQAGHCGAGIPGHLSCRGATRGEKQRVQERVDALSRAIQAHVDPKVRTCNELMQRIAGAAGYKGFAGKTADQMLEHLLSEKNVEQSVRDGWRFVSFESTQDRPKLMTVEEAMQWANGGRLVIGIIHSKVRNQMKPADDNGGRPYAHGHVFVVTPGGTPGTGWQGCPVANAGSGSDPGARRTTANWVTRGWEREGVVFLAWEKQN